MLSFVRFEPIPCGHEHAHLSEMLACAEAHPEVVRFRIVEEPER